MSFGQLVAIKNALAKDHSDPLADELYSELEWYLANVPGPGESNDDLKKAEEAADTGLASPEAADDPRKASVDDLLPDPAGEDGAPPPGAGPDAGGAPAEDTASSEDGAPPAAREEDPDRTDGPSNPEAKRFFGKRGSGGSPGADERVPAPPTD